jgi:hypothetical protein
MEIEGIAKWKGKGGLVRWEKLSFQLVDDLYQAFKT